MEERAVEVLPVEIFLAMGLRNLSPHFRHGVAFRSIFQELHHFLVNSASETFNGIISIFVITKWKTIFSIENSDLNKNAHTIPSLQNLISTLPTGRQVNVKYLHSCVRTCLSVRLGSAHPRQEFRRSSLSDPWYRHCRPRPRSACCTNHPSHTLAELSSDCHTCNIIKE